MASVGGFFKSIAPMLTTALNFVPGGGVAAQIASSIVSKVTGTDTKPEQLESTLANLATTEDGRLKLQQSEQEYQKAMTQLGYDNAEKLAEVAAGDRASARAREVSLKDKYVPVLATVVVGSFIVGVLAVLRGWGKVEAAFAGTLIGYLAANANQVISYYFGSSATHDALTLGKQG